MFFQNIFDECGMILESIACILWLSLVIQKAQNVSFDSLILAFLGYLTFLFDTTCNMINYPLSSEDMHFWLQTLLLAAAVIKFDAQKAMIPHVFRWKMVLLWNGPLCGILCYDMEYLNCRHNIQFMMVQTCILPQLYLIATHPEKCKPFLIAFVATIFVSRSCFLCGAFFDPDFEMVYSVIFILIVTVLLSFASLLIFCYWSVGIKLSYWISPKHEMV